MSNTDSAAEARAFLKQGSVVQAFDAKGNPYKGYTCYAPNAPAVKEKPDLLFARCVVQMGSTPQVLKLKQIEPKGNDEVFECKASLCYNDNGSIDPSKYEDIGGLAHTNAFAVLDYVRARFMKEEIFCTADPLLIVLNPFKDVKNATQQVIEKYANGQPNKLGCHNFLLAKEAANTLVTMQKSQSIIVSGESGAGKTESTKQIMRYLAYSKGGLTDSKVQEAILAANPVLEAFGNAKTLRNDNSSRFGRFMTLIIQPRGGIQYGNVIGFLLEKSRVVHQGAGERNYHIFYEILKGAPDVVKQHCKLLTLEEYPCLPNDTVNVPSWDDVEEFKLVHSALLKMGFSDQERQKVYDIVSGCMLISKISLLIGGDESADWTNCIPMIKQLSELWVLNFDKLVEALTVKETKAGQEVIKGVFTKDQGVISLESLAKGVYEQLFVFIKSKLNEIIKPPTEMAFMGMLDIFGFEVFKNNSLEQLFINVTNEYLQKNFVDTVFKKENELYKREGVSIGDLKYTSNDDIINVLIGRGGIFSSLEDQCVGSGDDKRCLAQIYTTCAANPRLKKAKINPAENFIVSHVIGDIQYNIDGFIRKNMDVLRGEFVEVLQASECTVMKHLYAGIEPTKGGLPKGKLIGSQYLIQLNKMMTTINATECHFIRCVKTNDEKKPISFTPSKVLIQFYALSVFEALQLRALGYSYRRPFKDFLYEFRFINMEAYEGKGDLQDRARNLLASAGLKSDNETVGIGKTMVFLKKTKLIYLQKKVREAPATWEPIVGCMEALYLTKVKMNAISKYQLQIDRLQAHARRLIEVNYLS